MVGAEYLDLVDTCGMKWEDPLDAGTERHLANGHGGTRPTILEGDDHAFEDLKAFLVALGNADVYFDSVARTKLGEIAFELAGV